MQIGRAILPIQKLGRIDRDFVLRQSDSPSQFHHLLRVLRIKSGQKIELLDEFSSKKLSGVVTDLAQDKISLTIEQESETKTTAPLTLVLGLPEFDVLENVIEKITELQLSEVKIFIPQHTQHKDAFKRLSAKLLRLEKIRDAARIQSGSGPVRIEIFQNLSAALDSIEALKEASYIRLIASLQPEASNLQEYLHKNHPLEPTLNNTDIILVVGPEGDLSFEEYEKCRIAKFIPISLGASVLRVETAVISSAFCLFNYFNR